MTTPTTERLAEALTAAGAPDAMVEAAAQGYYDDFKSPLPAPQMQLIIDARQYGLEVIAEAVIAGEFDASEQEANDWLASDDAQAILDDLLGQSGEGEA